MATIEEVARRIKNGVGASGGKRNDLEFMARLYEDDTISDTGSGNDLQRRLVTILDASSSGGVMHEGGIFGDCHDGGFQLAFQDPYPNSNNQVGHFTTAVDMGFRPWKANSLLLTYGFSAYAPEVLQKGPNTTHGHTGIPEDEYDCIALIIAHERIDDNWFGNIPIAALAALFSESEGIPKFYQALNSVPISPSKNLSWAYNGIGGISIGHGYGNSMQDLMLSLYGFKFGKMIRLGQMTTRSEAAQWIRTDIGGADAAAQVPGSTAYA